MNAKQQFNVYLPGELIRRLKHSAVDADQSLSGFVESILSGYLSGAHMDRERRMFTPLPIVYISDMARSLAFYQAVGFTIHTRGDVWSELRMGETRLALHTTPEPTKGQLRVALAMVCHVPLERVVAQFQAAGIELRHEIADEAFGRSLLLHDPDGLPLQIDEHDPELYG